MGISRYAEQKEQQLAEPGRFEIKSFHLSANSFSFSYFMALHREEDWSVRKGEDSQPGGAEVQSLPQELLTSAWPAVFRRARGLKISFSND